MRPFRRLARQRGGLDNARVGRHLAQCHAEIHAEFARLVETRGLADAPKVRLSVRSRRSAFAATIQNGGGTKTAGQDGRLASAN